MNLVLKRSIISGLTLSLVLVAGCGGSKASGTSTQWAEQLCSDTQSLTGAVANALQSVKQSQQATSVSDVTAATQGPLKTVQSQIEKIDEVFSSTKIVGTPLEFVRNQIGKQLNNVYPAYDEVDAFNSAAKSASSTAALAGPLSDLESTLGAASNGTRDLRGAVVVFKLSKDKAVAKAFTSGPECKKIK